MMIKQSQFVLKSSSFQILLQFSAFFVRFNRIGALAIASSLLLGVTFALVAQTPPSLKRLPPPPTPGSPRSIPSATARPASVFPKEPTQVQSISSPFPGYSSQASTSMIREYTFQAPQTPPPRSIQSRPTSFKPAPFKPAQVKPIQPNLNQNLNQKNKPIVLSSSANSRSLIYRVEIPGTDETLLTQVRSVEPLAVIWNQQGVIYGGIFAQQQLAQERVHQLQKKGVSAKIVPLSRPK